MSIKCKGQMQRLIMVHLLFLLPLIASTIKSDLVCIFYWGVNACTWLKKQDGLAESWALCMWGWRGRREAGTNIQTWREEGERERLKMRVKKKEEREWRASDSATERWNWGLHAYRGERACALSVMHNLTWMHWLKARYHRHSGTYCRLG